MICHVKLVWIEINEVCFVSLFIKKNIYFSGIESMPGFYWSGTFWTNPPRPKFSGKSGKNQLILIGQSMLWI